MDGIELMVFEHTIIKRALRVVQNMAYKVLKGEDINFKDFEMVIDFIRNYADSHHHAKEEKFLFNRMEEEVGPVATKLIKHGMLVEHDLGRLFIQDLEIALGKVKEGNEFEKINVIANAVGYVNLLDRHIDKEDSVVYTFARKQLQDATIQEINLACKEHEDECESKGIQNKYTTLVKELEGKYLS